MNKVIVMGNLTHSNELKTSESGLKYLKNSLAVNRKFKGQNGELKDEVMFIDLVFWGKTAEIANQYFQKGSKILIEGKLVQDNWTAQDGSKKSKHSISVENIDFIDSKKQEAGNTAQEVSTPVKQNRFTAPAYKPAPAPTKDNSADYYVDEDGENDRLPF